MSHQLIMLNSDEIESLMSRAASDLFIKSSKSQLSAIETGVLFGMVEHMISTSSYSIHKDNILALLRKRGVDDGSLVLNGLRRKLFINFDSTTNLLSIPSYTELLMGFLNEKNEKKRTRKKIPIQDLINEIFIGAEDELMSSNNIAITFLLKNNINGLVSFKFIDEQQKLYKNINVYDQLNRLVGWCKTHESQRKTPKRAKQFINTWLSTAAARLDTVQVVIQHQKAQNGFGIGSSNGVIDDAPDNESNELENENFGVITLAIPKKISSFKQA